AAEAASAKISACRAGSPFAISYISRTYGPGSSSAATVAGTGSTSRRAIHSRIDSQPAADASSASAAMRIDSTRPSRTGGDLLHRLCDTLLRNRDAEVSAGEFIRIDDFDRAVMSLHAFLHHRKADSGARDVSPLFLAPLEERVEYARSFVLRYSRAGVGEFDHETVGSTRRTHGDRTAGRRELDGVRQQVVEHRSHLVLVGAHDEIVDVEPQVDPPALECQPLRLGDVDDLRTQRVLRQREHLALRLPRAEAQEVLDELLQLDAVGAQDVRHFALRLGELPDRAVEQKLGALADVGERCLELVRHVAQEAVLFLGELEQPDPQPVELAPEALEV